MPAGSELANRDVIRTGGGTYSSQSWPEETTERIRSHSPAAHRTRSGDGAAGAPIRKPTTPPCTTPKPSARGTMKIATALSLRRDRRHRHRADRATPAMTATKGKAGSAMEPPTQTIHATKARSGPAMNRPSRSTGITPRRPFRGRGFGSVREAVSRRPTRSPRSRPCR